MGKATALTEFLLGHPQPVFASRAAVPWMLSYVSYSRYINDAGEAAGLKAAICEGELDSGAFTLVGKHGCFPRWGKPYAEDARTAARALGNVRRIWAQDMPCEPSMLRRTGLTVRQHQELTIDSIIELRTVAPDLPFAPVLQGLDPEIDYLRHMDMYASRKVDLFVEEMVGIGTLCCRKRVAEVIQILGGLWRAGMRRMHGFGLMIPAYRVVARLLAQGDSQAIYSHARRNKVLLPGHDRPGGVRRFGHQNCGVGCLDLGLQWVRDTVQPAIEEGMRAPMPSLDEQLNLFEAA